MNKIIAAFDGLRFSESTMQYSVYIAKKYNAQITGVFLRESTSLAYTLYTMLEEGSALGKDVMKEIDSEDNTVIGEAIENFKSSCLQANLKYRVHFDKENAARELIHETVFADLLIIDASESFSYLEANKPSSFIRNILHATKCPVLIVPKVFSPIEKSVLLYDGSSSSIFAIKMLNYIMPGMSKLETKVMYATKNSHSHHLPHEKIMKEWINDHFSRVRYEILAGEHEELISNIMQEDGDALIVAGSYHRSTFSMWLNQSLADPLLRKIKAPVFIAHG
jgi:nucleotide-binding universal stress UspA family protein